MVRKYIRKIIMFLIFILGIYIVSINMIEKEVRKVEIISIR